MRVCVWAARAARLSSISVNRQPSRKKPKFFFLTTFCLRHVCLCAGSVPRREHQRPPSGNSEKKCKFWTIRLRHVCLRMCVPRVCPSEAASAPDSVRASASTVSRKTCVCVRDAVRPTRKCAELGAEKHDSRDTRACAPYFVRRANLILPLDGKLVVCVCVCVCGGEGKSDVSPVGRKENRTRRAPLASISVNRQTLESSARVFARECASVRVRGENIPVKEDRKGCVDPKQPGCAGSTPPSMAGARFRKRVRVRGYIDGSRISNGYHTNKSDRLGAGKMYARLRPWHRKGVRAWAVCVTSP